MLNDLQEFNKKVKELKMLLPTKESPDTRIVDFGYKTLKGNEIFSIVDFENVGKWIVQDRKNLIKEIIKILQKEKEKYDDSYDYWEWIEEIKEKLNKLI